MSPRVGATAVWTGSEVIFWGGGGPGSVAPGGWGPLRDGAAYDPTDDSWRTISAAPIPTGTFSAVWTGDEMILWGADLEGREASAAYDPRTDAWREPGRSPLDPRSGHVAAWTGSEMIVWGGEIVSEPGENYDGRGAAYDPAADSWRMLPRGPLPAGYDAMGSWSGQEMLLLVTPLDESREDRPKRMLAAAYDPGRDAWRDLARPDFAPWLGPPTVFADETLFLLSTFGTIDGGEVNPFDRAYETGGIYSVARDDWRSHAHPKARPLFGMVPVVMDDLVVVDGLVYDPARDSWTPLPALPLEQPRSRPSAVWTGSELILWGGEEGSVGSAIDPPPVVGDGAAYKPA